MSSPISVDVFVEDRAHEAFLVPLLLRIAKAFKAGIGFGSEFVNGMDLYRAAQGDHSKAFLDDLRGKLSLLRPEWEGRVE